ncbi:MAG: two-component system response regulator [Phycisphaerae bacterium]
MTHRVLVVDDDPGILYTVRHLLSNGGFDVSTAEGGEHCLQQLREGFRGVILMDIMMPRLNGWQTIGHMLDERLVEGNVISMLTAVGDPGGEGEPAAEVVVDYIRKPFRAEDLLEQVRQFATYLDPAGAPISPAE